MHQMCLSHTFIPANAFARPKRLAIQTTPMMKGRGRDLQPRKRRSQT